MGKLRTAVIGAGKMGAIHAKVYSRMENCVLTAVVDCDPARAKALADVYGCRAETDPNAILDSVDAVTISAPLRRTVRWLNFFLNIGFLC